MTLTHLLTQYGYLAVFIGTLLEGETVLTLAGFFVHQGYLHYVPTVIAAVCGAILGDQAFFFLGRFYGNAIVARFPRLAPAVDKIEKMILKHQIPLVLGIRFMYGMRIAGPIAIGMSRVGIVRFTVLNTCGAILWAVLIVTLGYVFGQTLHLLFDDIKKYEGWVALVLAIVVAGFLLYRCRRRKKGTGDMARRDA